MKKNVKAFILASGYGSRLKPLTEHAPKVLTPIFGVPLLYTLIEKITKIGIKEIFINTHHLGDHIVNAVRKYPTDAKIYFSKEEGDTYGTAGAYFPLREKFKDSDLLAINGDMVSNFDLQKLVNKHQNSKAIATMGLLNPPFPSKTKVWCNTEQIQTFGGEKPTENSQAYSFAVAQMLSYDFLKEIKTTPSQVIPLYKSLINKGAHISFEAQKAFWYDLGCLKDYWELHEELFKDSDSTLLRSLEIPTVWKKLGFDPVFEKEPPFFSMKNISFGKNSKIWGPLFNFSSLEKLPDNFDCANTILMPGTTLDSIKKMAPIKDAIISNDFHVFIPK